MIWKDRKVKIENGVLFLSEKGSHDDFKITGLSRGPLAIWGFGLSDGLKEPSYPKSAFVSVIDSEKVLMIVDLSHNVWFMAGEPWTPTCRIEAVAEMVVDAGKPAE